VGGIAGMEHDPEIQAAIAAQREAFGFADGVGHGAEASREPVEHLTATATFDIVVRREKPVCTLILILIDLAARRHSLTMFLGPNLAGVPARMIESSNRPGTAWSTSLPGQNPAVEDALMQVMPIRDVSKLELPIK
jgi:hypothetical protein